jgi:hypothetical protein
MDFILDHVDQKEIVEGKYPNIVYYRVKSGDMGFTAHLY